MESPWILVVETACGGEPEQAGASSSHRSHDENGGTSSSSSSTAPTFRQTTVDAWKNHSATAFLECDIVLFPEDLTLSRQDFLASVWRLPRQNLYPCGRENLLLFPPMNVTEYSIAFSACQMHGTAIFSESLVVSTAATTDAAVIWQDATIRNRKKKKKLQQEEMVLAHVQVVLDVEQARQQFSTRLESMAFLKERGVDTNVHSVDTRGGKKTEIMMLLESIKTKMEGDVRAVDQILTFMAIVSLFLVLCLIKLVFFDAPLRKPRRTPEGAPLVDPAAPLGAWLSTGSARTGNAIFRTPRTPDGDVPDAAPTTVVGSGVIGASPCQNLAKEWTRRKDERRRCRTLDMGPRRLVPPTNNRTLTEKEDEPTADPNSGETIMTLRVNRADRKILPLAPEDDVPDQDHIVPERLARSLWGFGM